MCGGGRGLVTEYYPSDLSRSFQLIRNLDAQEADNRGHLEWLTKEFSNLPTRALHASSVSSAFASSSSARNGVPGGRAQTANGFATNSVRRGSRPISDEEMTLRLQISRSINAERRASQESQAEATKLHQNVRSPLFSPLAAPLPPPIANGSLPPRNRRLATYGASPRFEPNSTKLPSPLAIPPPFPRASPGPLRSPSTKALTAASRSASTPSAHLTLPPAAAVAAALPVPRGRASRPLLLPETRTIGKTSRIRCTHLKNIRRKRPSAGLSADRNPPRTRRTLEVRQRATKTALQSRATCFHGTDSRTKSSRGCGSA